MEKVKFLTGSFNNLPEEIVPGTIYFAITDDENKIGQILFDIDNNRYQMSQLFSNDLVAFATCETPGGNSNKEIILNEDNTWDFIKGKSLFVYYKISNKNMNPTFTIKTNNQEVVADNLSFYCGEALCQNVNIEIAGKNNRIIHYIYDGKNMQFVDWTDPLDSTANSNIKPFNIDDSIILKDSLEENNKEGIYPLELDSNGVGYVKVPKIQPLKIGPHTYDGTEEVQIAIYNGEKIN